MTKENNYEKTLLNLKYAKKRAKKIYFDKNHDEGWKLAKEENGVKIFHGKGKDIHIKTTTIIKANQSDIIDKLYLDSQNIEEVTEHR